MLNLGPGDNFGVVRDGEVALLCEVTSVRPNGSIQATVINGAWEFLLTPDMRMHYLPDGKSAGTAEDLYLGPWPSSGDWRDYGDTLAYMQDHYKPSKLRKLMLPLLAPAGKVIRVLRAFKFAWHGALNGFRIGMGWPTKPTPADDRTVTNYEPGDEIPF